MKKKELIEKIYEAVEKYTKLIEMEPDDADLNLVFHISSNLKVSKVNSLLELICKFGNEREMMNVIEDMRHEALSQMVSKTAMNQVKAMLEKIMGKPIDQMSEAEVNEQLKKHAPGMTVSYIDISNCKNEDEVQSKIASRVAAHRAVEDSKEGDSLDTPYSC